MFRPEADSTMMKDHMKGEHPMMQQQENNNK